jgi:hypothetical protein
MDRLALALSVVVLMATGAQAQVVQQESTVAAGVAPVPATPVPQVPPTVATAIVRTFQPVCELRREQFQDEFGWRVRDIRICR